jgi:hypothetical protein
MHLHVSSRRDGALRALDEVVCPNRPFVREVMFYEAEIDQRDFVVWDRDELFSTSITYAESPHPEAVSWSSRLGSMTPELTIGPATDSALISIGVRFLDPPSFDIYGDLANISTSYTGYNVVFGVGLSSWSSLIVGRSVLLSGITLLMTWVTLSSNSILLCFTFENSFSYNQQARVSVDTDIRFNWDNRAPVSHLASNRGFTISDDGPEMTFICRDYPLVTDVSAYWCGSQSSRSDSLWVQSNGTNFTGDSGLAYSWQDVDVPPGESVQRSMIIKFGLDSNGVVPL